MPFVQPQFLAALAALAIPIVIHLLFRRRSRNVNLGTLRFLKIVLNENARRRKVKRWALLALRMACVALLAVLFARPYLVAREAGTKDRFVSILIDRSASMQLKERGGRLLDRAVEQARELAQRLGEKTQIELAFFDQTLHPLNDRRPEDAAAPASVEEARSRSRASLLSLEAPATTWSGTNYGAALAWARDACLTAPHRRKELYLYTDLQRSGLDWTNTDPLPADVAVHLVDLGRPSVNNVAVTAVQPSRTLVRPGDTVTVATTIFNSAPFALEKAPVVLSLESGTRKHVLRERISLEAGAVGSVGFELPALGEGRWKGMIRVEWDDELSFDNQRYFAIHAAPPVPVLLVENEPADAGLPGETYFLEMALRLALPGESFVESPFAPTTVIGTSGLPNLNAAQIVVLANPAGLRQADARRLGEWVQAGGRLLVFGGERVDAAGARALAACGLTVGEVRGTARARELPFRLQEWDETHPLFEPFNDPQHGDLRRLSFTACTRIEPDADARVLARFRGGHPALVEKPLERGKVLWFTSTCDREWSQWTRSRLYLPFMHQMLGYLAGLTGGGPIRESLVDAPANSAVDAVPGVTFGDELTLVVNVSPRESETDRCTPDDFANRFQLKLSEDAEAATLETPLASAAAGPGADLRDDEIWHWFLLGLLGFLMIESFVANRTAA